MKRTWMLIFMVCALWASLVSAFGNLGETLNQINARYGNPLRLTDYGLADTPVTVYRYQVNGQIIQAEIFKDVCIAETIVAPRGGLSERTCLEFATRVANETNWTKFPWDDTNGPSWRASNTLADALWDRGLGLPDLFSVRIAILSQYAQETGKDWKFPWEDPPKSSGQSKAGIKEDVASRLLKWQKDLAEKGDIYGEYQMGLRYRDGNGVPHDLEKAREWLKKAADHGDKDAASALAKLPLPTTLVVATNSAKLTIRSAEFGMGQSAADVTAKVKELLNTPTDSFVADAKTLGSDPLPGKKKQLVIRYEYNGTNYVLKAPGASRVSYRSLERNALK